jgi:mono/diheme cytochrome c family protein
MMRAIIPALLAAIMLCGAARAADAAAGDEAARLARGEYLAHMADCEACHRGADGTLSGGRAFKTPLGTIYATNLTPDPLHGVGSYSDEEWLAALQRGVARGGKHLYPAMPYTNYTLMTRDDALAIKAYIFSLPASPAVTPAAEMRFPFNIRFLMVVWNLLFNPDHRFAPDAGRDAAWNRGAYLAEALGHCQQCHSPRNFLQGLKSGRAYAGYVQQGWMAYNITSDAQSGIGSWSEADIATYLSSGRADGHGMASGPMAEAVSYSLRYLTPADARALAHYVKSIAPIRTAVAATQVRDAEDALGAKLFAGACASCHRLDGTGTQSPYAALLGDPSVADPAGTNLLQAVLHGSALMTPDGRVGMPGFSGGYTNAELAAVADYTIAHFGQVAGRVSASTVARLRDGDPGAGS